MRLQSATAPRPAPRNLEAPARTSQPVPATADQVDAYLADPAAKAALHRSYATLLAHTSGTVAASLTGCKAAELMFHGTSSRFEELEPRPNRRMGREGQVEWSGTAIFAAMDPRVALQYTATRGAGVSTGVNLRGYTSPEQPLAIHLYGGNDLSDAMNRVYGDPARPESCIGYIHLLDKSGFVHEQGLGCMEKLTRDSSADLGQIAVDRRAALAELQEQGLITLNWSPSF